jgi:hypothetical protein
MFWSTYLEIITRAGVYLTILKCGIQTLIQLLLYYRDITNSGDIIKLIPFS